MLKRLCFEIEGSVCNCKIPQLSWGMDFYNNAIFIKCEECKYTHTFPVKSLTGRIIPAEQDPPLPPKDKEPLPEENVVQLKVVK